MKGICWRFLLGDLEHDEHGICVCYRGPYVGRFRVALDCVFVKCDGEADCSLGMRQGEPRNEAGGSMGMRQGCVGMRQGSLGMRQG